MKTNFNTFIIAFFLSLISFSALADFKAGKDAYDRKDWLKAITELRPLAESGDERAMIILANMYAEGLGVVQSFPEAFSLYRRAAEKNNPEAMVAVAAMYTSGLGVHKSLNTSMKWFERAALLGNQTGAFFYGTILFQGNKSDTDDIKPDVYNAYKWFKIASLNTQNSKMQEAAGVILKAIATEKLSKEDIVKADKEAVEWKPVDVSTLGPAPADPVPATATPVKTPEEKQTP